jgi:hypothetical protein
MPAWRGAARRADGRGRAVPPAARLPPRTPLPAAVGCPSPAPPPAESLPPAAARCDVVLIAPVSCPAHPAPPRPAPPRPAGPAPGRRRGAPRGSGRLGAQTLLDALCCSCCAASQPGGIKGGSCARHCAETWSQTQVKAGSEARVASLPSCGRVHWHALARGRALRCWLLLATGASRRRRGVGIGSGGAGTKKRGAEAGIGTCQDTHVGGILNGGGLTARDVQKAAGWKSN